MLSDKGIADAALLLVLAMLTSVFVSIMQHLITFYGGHKPFDPSNPCNADNTWCCRRKSSQWFGLTRPHAEVLVGDVQLMEVFRKDCRPHFVRRFVPVCS